MVNGNCYVLNSKVNFSILQTLRSRLCSLLSTDYVGHASDAGEMPRST